MLNPERVREAVEELDDDHRRVLEARCSGLSVTETEEKTGIARGTVYAYQRDINRACGASDIKEVCAELARQREVSKETLADPEPTPSPLPNPESHLEQVVSSSPPQPEPASNPQPAPGGRIIIPDSNTQSRRRRSGQIRPRRSSMLIPILLVFAGIAVVLLLIFGLASLGEGINNLTGAISDFLDRGGQEDETEPSESSASSLGTTLDDLDIIEGRITRKPDTVVREVAYPDAVWLNDGRIVIRTLQRYESIRVTAGIDDTGGLRGQKRIWVIDNEGNTLDEDVVRPVSEPVFLDVPISHADWVEVNVLDYNNQPGGFIRILEVVLIPKP